jgi:SAM-dependent methyltransferase
VCRGPGTVLKGGWNDLAGRPVGRSRPGPGAEVGAFALPAEEAEDLDGSRLGAGEPVRHPGVEFGGFARVEHEVLIAEYQPESTVENVEPLVPFMGLRLRGCRRAGGGNDQFVRLRAARTTGERHHRHAAAGDRTQVDPGIAGRWRADQFVDLYAVCAGQRQEEFQGRPALAGLQPGQGGDRDPGGRGQVGQRGLPLPAQRAQPGSDGGEYAIQVVVHVSGVCHNSKKICSFGTGDRTVVVMNHEHTHEHTHDSVPDLGTMFTQEFWDERYRSADRIWSGRANPHLVTTATDLAPATALDVGSGEGADVIWLASRGWRVTGVDVSQVALDRAAARAAEAGPEIADRITWQRADVFSSDPAFSWDPAPQRFDLVSAQFMQMPQPALEALHRRLAAAVRPGGTLLIVGHHPSDLETNIGRPHLPELMFTAEQVAGVLDPDEWHIVTAEPERPAVAPDGSSITIRDAVLRAVRH